MLDLSTTSSILPELSHLLPAQSVFSASGYDRMCAEQICRIHTYVTETKEEAPFVSNQGLSAAAGKYWKRDMGEGGPRHTLGRRETGGCDLH